MSWASGAGQRDAAWHWAFFYENADDYVDGVLRFVGGALAADRPVFVSVPARNGALLRANLEDPPGRVRFADMSQLGRNPNCIIPAIRAFIDEHAGQQVSFVGEPIWAGRTAAEIAEATRHEALINAAFADSGAHVFCPYDVAGLDAATVADAFRTHPELVGRTGERRASHHYEDPHAVWQDVGHLPPPPADACRRAIERSTVGELRALLRRVGAAAGLAADRVDVLVLAGSELVTNSLLHGGGLADVTVWAEPDRVCCETRDSGVVGDPLTGRHRPRPDTASGRGLWLVNQLCDLVQLHSSAAGTTVRITVCR
jgi:anti-sigma regulatory factor (Ser/Thr protein kinase)